MAGSYCCKSLLLYLAHLALSYIFSKPHHVFDERIRWKYDECSSIRVPVEGVLQQPSRWKTWSSECDTSQCLVFCVHSSRCSIFYRTSVLLLATHSPPTCLMVLDAVAAYSLVPSSYVQLRPYKQRRILLACSLVLGQHLHSCIFGERKLILVKQLPHRIRSHLRWYV